MLQMVSTPIGAPNLPESPTHVTYTSQFTPAIQNESLSIQPTHSLLYSRTESVAQQEISSAVSPVSLYNEFVGNPYNLPTNYMYGAGQGQPVLVYQSQPSEENDDSEESNVPIVEHTPEKLDTFYENQSSANIFQSSNYFYTDSSNTNIPPGSEILFGTDKNTLF